MKGLNSFRMLLLAIWVITWLTMCALMLGADSIRRDQAIGFDDRLEALLMLSPIWLTPLACFGAFWFPEDERRAAQRGTLPGTKKAAALVFTLPYLVLVLALVWGVVRADYSTKLVMLPSGESFLERIAKVVKFAGLLSPLALSPTLWITRFRSKTSPAAQNTKDKETPVANAAH